MRSSCLISMKLPVAPMMGLGSCHTQLGKCTIATVQPFLDVRAAVLNDTLEDAFPRRYPGFRPANDDEATALVS
jgi:hypothetical protein